MLWGKFAVGALTAVALGLGACQPNISGNQVTSSQAGQINQTVAGTVISYRPVTVQDQNPSYLTGAGAIAGGIGGSQIGGGDVENALGAIGGALAGGLAGYAVEQAVNNQTGVEYTVELDDGRVVTIVQGADQLYPPGSRVLIAYGQGGARIMSGAGVPQQRGVNQYPGTQYPGTQYPGTQYQGTQYPGSYPTQTYPRSY